MKWSKISSLSAYARPEAHLTRQTTHGAIVTIIGVLLGTMLTYHEVSWFLGGKGMAKMAVDLARRHDLDIKVDITFPAIPCAGLSVDVLDASGTLESDVNSASHRHVHLKKERLDGAGRRVRGKDGEYKTPTSQQQMQQGGGTVMSIDLGAAMQQMGDMETEITAHEGCRLHGDVQVRRVAGRLHFAVHQQSFLDILPQMLTGHQLPRLTNMSHIIHKLSFGPEFPGQENPLDGFHRILPAGSTLKAYRYFLKIVPTTYFTRMGVVLETSQYSVGEYAMPVAVSPDDGAGKVRYPYVDVSYDLSPIIMTINQSPASLLHFVVRLCAVVGGVLSMTRMLDLLVHSAVKAAGVVIFTPRTSAAGSVASTMDLGPRNSYASGLGGGGGGSTYHSALGGNRLSCQGSVLQECPSFPGPLQGAPSYTGSLQGAPSYTGGGGLQGAPSYAGGGPLQGAPSYTGSLQGAPSYTGPPSGGLAGAPRYTGVGGGRGYGAPGKSNLGQ